MIVSIRVAGERDVVDVDQALRGLDLRLDADPADLEAVGLLDLGEQQVQRLHLGGVGDLRQHDRVELGAGAADHLEHVVEGPLRRPVVDPDGADLLAPAALVQRRDDVLAGAGLGQRRAGVLEVEEHLVGRQALGLLQEPGVAARDGEVGTTGSELGHGASAAGGSTVGYRRVATRARAALRRRLRWPARPRVGGRLARTTSATPTTTATMPGQRQQRRRLVAAAPARRSARPAPPAGRRG